MRLSVENSFRDSRSIVIPRAAASLILRKKNWFRCAGDLLLAGDWKQQVPRSAKASLDSTPNDRGGARDDNDSRFSVQGLWPYLSRTKK